MKKGFTLSEILITLAVIGVVAALSLPTLNKTIKQQQASSALPKMYSELRNAARMYQAEHGIDIEDFDTSLSARDFLDTYFKPYFKGATSCDSTEECWKGGKKPLEIKRTINITTQAGLILADGSILAITRGPGGVVFFFDIDGAKGDNLSGHDIYNFYLVNMQTHTVDNTQYSGCVHRFNDTKVKSAIYPGGTGACFTPMVGFTKEQLLSSNNPISVTTNEHLDRPCNKNGKNIASGGGNACAVVLFQNNWKFPKGYPW